METLLANETVATVYGLITHASIALQRVFQKLKCLLRKRTIVNINELLLRWKRHTWPDENSTLKQLSDRALTSGTFVWRPRQKFELTIQHQ